MLILSRRATECICLGDDIVLTIVALGNDKVRIGVKAPPGVRILRNELEIQEQSDPVPAAAEVMPFPAATSVPATLHSTPADAPDESGDAPDAADRDGIEQYAPTVKLPQKPGARSLKGFISNKRAA